MWAYPGTGKKNKEEKKEGKEEEAYLPEKTIKLSAGFQKLRGTESEGRIQEIQQ